MIKLYPKKLNSIAALRKEKALRKAEAHMSIGNSGPGDDEIVPDLIQTGFDFFTSKGLVNKLYAIALPALSLAGRKLEKDIIKSLAKEFVTGYAKWKAIELGVKAAFSFFRKKPDKGPNS